MYRAHPNRAGSTAFSTAVDLSSLADTALDRTVALGYGRLGMQARRLLPGWPPDPPRIDGDVVLVTGATSGIGLAACQGFARLGARVLAVARSAERAEEAVRQIRAAVPDADARPLACDVSNLVQVRKLVDTVAEEEQRLHVLVHNAGVMPEQRSHSGDGHELMFATHVLAPFALTSWCRGLLELSGPARVITVSSGGMYAARVPLEDFESERESYGARKLYARTKREQVVLSELWAERLKGSRVVVHAMHPGWVDTGGLERAMPAFHKAARALLRTPEQGADTIVWLGASPQALLSTGGFWQDRRERPTRYLLGSGQEPAAAPQRLWDYCESLVAGAR